MKLLKLLWSFLQSVFVSFSEILFLQSKIVGAILVFITFFSPRTGISGLCAVFSVWTFSYLIRFQDRLLKETCYIYNPLLVGMSIGFLFDSSLKFFCLAAIAGIFTFFVTFVTVNILAKVSLPALSLPFSLVGIVLYLAAIKYLSVSPATSPGSPLGSVLKTIAAFNGVSHPQRPPVRQNLQPPPGIRPPPFPVPPGFPPPRPPEGMIPSVLNPQNSISDTSIPVSESKQNKPAPSRMNSRTEPNHPILQPAFVKIIPTFIRKYFAALGSLFFIPFTLAGIIIALMLLIHSRILFFLSVAGFYTGILFHSIFLGSFDAAIDAEFSFNYILISIALGGVYIVPSVRSIAISVAGIGIAVLFTDMIGIFLSLFKIPAFTLPFNLVVIPALYILRSIHFKEFAWSVKSSPEKTLNTYLLKCARFPGADTSVFLPFSGRWTVYQGFDGEWTHQGDWRYAYDFVITDNNKKTYSNTGNILTDYFAYKKPVLSPVRGYVVKSVAHFKDNAISEVDTHNNWGNHVIIRSSSGFFVELSHFSENSLKVAAGDYVEVGQLLGLCGNSGYSPQPHIHVQIQQTAELGAKTLPFSFVNYREKNHIQWFKIPAKDAMVESVSTDNDMNTILSFTLDVQYEYEFFQNNVSISQQTFTVCMDHISGKFFFKDADENRLYFSKDSGMFYFYDYHGNSNTPLNMLYAAIPRIPLAAKPGISWNDTVPRQFLNKHQMYDSLLAVFHSTAIFSEGSFELLKDFTIKGFYKNEQVETIVILDAVNGFNKIACNGLMLLRK